MSFAALAPAGMAAVLVRIRRRRRGGSAKAPPSALRRSSPSRHQRSSASGFTRLLRPVNPAAQFRACGMMPSLARRRPAHNRASWISTRPCSTASASGRRATSRGKRSRAVLRASGLPRRGRHRAPKGRGQEGQYWRFCLDHVRVYNASYNYFAGHVGRGGRGLPEGRRRSAIGRPGPWASTRTAAGRGPARRAERDWDYVDPARRPATARARAGAAGGPGPSRAAALSGSRAPGARRARPRRDGGRRRPSRRSTRRW